MGYSPRYHIYTNEFPDQHSETDDWACVESEMRRAKESGAIKADYAAYVIDTHTGQRTYFDSTGVKSPHGGRPMTLREVMDAEAPAQPPCSECATLQKQITEIAEAVSRLPTVTGLQESCVKDHSLIKLAILDSQATFKDTVARKETECATLRKERDDANGRIDEAWGKVNSLDRQKAHLLEVYARISKEKEAAEAQLSTLKKWFMDHWNEIDRAGIYDRYLIRAALAPTPEVAPHMTKVNAGIFTSTLCTCPNQTDEDGAHCPICGKLKPVNGVAPKE